MESNAPSMIDRGLPGESRQNYFPKIYPFFTFNFGKQPFGYYKEQKSKKQKFGTLYFALHNNIEFTCIRKAR